MRILMIAPTPFFAHRGCHVRILEEMRALGALGHEVVLCTYGLGDEVPGARTIRTIRVPWYRKLTAGPSWHKLYLDVLLLWTSLRCARRFRPDVIHAHLHEGAFLGAIVARLAGGIPLLGDFQGSMTTEMTDHGFFSGWSWGERVFVQLEGWINRAPTEVVVSSSQALAPIARARPGRESSVSFLLDAVDADVFRPTPERRDEMRRRFGIAPADRVIAYLGLLTGYQGVDLLLEAAPGVVARLPETRFLIMGFPNEDRYRRRAAELGLADRVVFTGRIDYADAAAALAAAEVAVSPKISLTEANGKLLNYMACGLPTVAFDTHVNREILGDLGVFARYGDAQDLAAKLLELLADETRRARLSTELRTRAVEAFSRQGQGRRFEAIYSRLTGLEADSGGRESQVA